MKSLWLCLLFLLFTSANYGQTIPGRIHVGTKDYSGSCSPNGLLAYNVSDGKRFDCTGGSWVSSNGVPPQTSTDFQFSGTPTMACVVGDSGFQTDATPGQNIWLCTAANTWTQQSSGGAGGAVSSVNGATGAVVAPTCFKPQTVNYNEATLVATSGTTASINLSNIALPSGFKVTAVTIKPLTAFTASGMTALSISLGGNGNNTAYSIACQTGSSCDPTATASNTNMLDDGGHYSVTWAAHTPYLYFSSTGANLNTLTAGSVNVYVCGVNLPSTAQVVP